MDNKLKFSPKRELILPEYGRNIQHLVEYAVSLPTKEERMQCASTIIRIMGQMFPYLRDIEGFKYKLWDHLAIISDFKLDIDYPFEITQKEHINPKPEKVEYPNHTIRYRHYGRNVQRFIEEVVSVKDPAEREAKTQAICQYLKKSLIEWNKETATDQKVIGDIRELSDGRLIVAEDTQFMRAEDFRRNRPQKTHFKQNKQKNNKKRPQPKR